MEEYEQEIYQLQEDDDYFKCCGEIFLTLKGHLILHCTLCEQKHVKFEEYCDHLKKNHLFETDEDAPEYNEVFRYEIQTEDGRPDVIEVDLISEGSVMENVVVEMRDEMIKAEEEETMKAEEEEVNIEVEVIEDAEPSIDEKLKTHNDDVKIEDLRPNVRKKTKKNAPAPGSTCEIKAESSKGIVKCEFDSNTKTTKKAVPSNIKLLSCADLDPECYHELPSCDRPRLNPSRKPASSLSSEERKHKCPYCPFASKDKTNLWSHIQRHSNNKPHQCSYCPKSFHTRVELTFHTRYHTGERPYQCTECARNFVTKEQLKQHLKRHNNQRDYHCPECSKGFFSSQEVREHMVVHTKETPFKCDQCEGVFTRKKALIAHKKLHENKRSYKCSYCDAGFNQAAGLNLHTKTKHQIFNREEMAYVSLDTSSN